MKKILAIVTTVLILVTGSVAPISAPRGVQLQQMVGDNYEVIYNPSTGAYTIEAR